MGKFYEKFAVRHLNRLRDQEPLRSTPFDFNTTEATLNRWLTDGNLTLESIGSSADELRELRVKFYMNKAQVALATFRGQATCMDTIRNSLREAGKTLEDIGTSEEELKNLDVEYSRKKALNFLARARNERGLVNNHKMVEAVRHFLSRGNLKVEDIDTSDGELTLLAA